MSADRQIYSLDRKDGAAGGRLEWAAAAALMPATIATMGAADRPVECLVGLQSAMARAVRVAAEIGRVPDFLMSRLSGCRRALDVPRNGGSALTQH